MKKGREEGRGEGLEKGRKETTDAGIRNALSLGKLTMADIAAINNVTEAYAREIARSTGIEE